jgi:hypothetical protein
VGKAALAGDNGDVCTGPGSQKLAARLLEAFVSQEFDRRTSDELLEMLFKGTPCDAADFCEIADFPGSRQICPQRSHRYFDVTWMQLSRHPKNLPTRRNDLQQQHIAIVVR